MSYMTFAREANRPDPKLAIPIASDDRRPSKSRRAWYAMRGLIRLMSEAGRCRRFQRGPPGYGQPYRDGAQAEAVIGAMSWRLWGAG